jgi:MFS family permease
MSIFSLCIMASTGLGSVMGGFIEQYPNLQWRWIQWISLMYVLFSYGMMQPLDRHFSLASALSVAIPVFLEETRSTVLLMRIAKKMRKETGDQRYRARAEDELPGLRVLLWITLTRPLCTFLL